MYIDTIAAIDYFNKEFEKAEGLLKRKIVSEESLQVKRFQQEAEDAMNLEYCDISSELLDEQDIVERLNETDDFIFLSEIINDRIMKMNEDIEDAISSLNDIRESLKEDTFFDDNELLRKDLLKKYVELGEEHNLYPEWRILLEGTVTREMYRLIEDALHIHLQGLENKLKSIKESIFYVDLNCFSEGNLVKIQDFMGNQFVIRVNGWFCPERGSVDEIYVSWLENGMRCIDGGIYISYGDYEMTEDDIPIPYMEDELIVNFSKINDELKKVVDSIYEVLYKIEDKYIELEI